jgi:hypothetical protein
MEATVIAVISVLIATTAAVATAWQARLIRKQMQHEQNVAVATLYHTITHQFVELDRFFVDRPELRPFFYEGAGIPSDDPVLRSRVEAVAEMLFDLAESCHANNRVLEKIATDWDKYFSFIYACSPALRQYAKDHGHLYPKPVRLAFLGGPSYAEDLTRQNP